MSLHGYEREFDLKTIVENMVNWAEITTRMYNSELKKNVQRQYVAEKERLQKELAERKRNKELQDWLRREFT